MVRAAAARGLAVMKAPNAAGALADAVKTAQARRPVRGASRRARCVNGARSGDGAKPILTAALADKDWAVRVRAAENLEASSMPTPTSSSMRPAPPTAVPELAAIDAIIAPKYSPQAYIEHQQGRPFSSSWPCSMRRAPSPTSFRW